MYKRRLAINMFKEKYMLNRLSQHLKIMDSRCNGTLIEVPRKNLELGTDSLLFSSLRSTRFQSSYWAKVRAEAKKKNRWKGERERERRRGNACQQTPRF